MANPEHLRLLSDGYKAWNAAFKQTPNTPPDLSNADLTEVHRLSGFDLTGADLTGVNLQGARLYYITLDGATLDGADLTGAIICGARIREASLRGTLLANADLRDARLHGSDLTGVDLTGAKLDGCFLVNVDLDDALVGPNLGDAIRIDSEVAWPLLADTTHTIRLRVDVDRDQPDWPVVTILIDGEDALGLEGNVGFDPATLLSATSPLLPHDPPRRIAVYQCNCKIAGCGVMAPLIVDAVDTIEWRDFKNFVGAYTKPDTPNQSTGGTKLAVPNLRFDAEQYRAEVERATNDLSWETKPRKVSRLVSEILLATPAVFHGYRALSVGLYVEGHITVRLRRIAPVDSSIEFINVRIWHPDAPAEIVAANLAGQFRSSDHTEWNIVSKDFLEDIC